MESNGRNWAYSWLLTVQIEKYSVMPLHSVKIAGKRNPVISGTATQAILRKRRRICTEEELSREGKWLDPNNVCCSRESFISNIVTPEGRGLLDAFFDICFGIAFDRRESLVGMHFSKTPQLPRTARQKTSNACQNQLPVNFRTLLLSCFRQHGGVGQNEASLQQQTLIYVDICKQSAADIVTIHSKIAQIYEMVKPGEPDSPKYVVISGDQPTYKMIVSIWRQSYLEEKKRVTIGTR